MVITLSQTCKHIWETFKSEIEQIHKPKITHPQTHTQIKVFQKSKALCVSEGQKEGHFGKDIVYKVESIDVCGQKKFKSQNCRPSWESWYLHSKIFVCLLYGKKTGGAQKWK